MKISIIIPVFNERKTINQIIQAVERVDLGSIEKELIIVDDGSTDGTKEILAEFEKRHRVIYQLKNMGKGAALRRGFQEASGDYILNQDADLEYNPADYILLIKPIKDGAADVVFGSRHLDPAKNKYVYKRYLWGGLFLNLLVNLFTGIRINDIFSGSKLFPRLALKHISLNSNGFEIETELAIKLARAGYKILEIPISYKARRIEEGKKIRPIDAIKILKAAIKSRWFDKLTTSWFDNLS